MSHRSNASSGFSIKPAHEYLKPELDENTPTNASTPQQPSSSSVSTSSGVASNRGSSTRGMVMHTSPRSQADLY